MDRTLLSLPLVVALAQGTLCGQTFFQVTARAATALTVSANDSSGQHRQGLPLGTDLTSGFSLSASGTTANCWSQLAPAVYDADSVKVRLQASASNQGSPALGAASVGSHDVDIVLASVVRTRVRVTVSMNATWLQGGVGSGSIGASVIGGGSATLPMHGTNPQPVLLEASGFVDRNGFVIRLSQDLRTGPLLNPVPDQLFAETVVKVVADPDFPWRSGTSYGASCGVDCWQTANLVDLGVTRFHLKTGNRAQFAWLAFGTRRTDLPVFSCRAYNEWAVVVPLQLDPLGQASIGLAPPPGSGLAIEIQGLAWNGTQLSASAGVELVSY